MTTVIDVALPVPLRQNFSYLINNQHQAPKIGERVLVPFGQRQLLGIVINIQHKVDVSNYPFELKAITSVISQSINFPAQLLAWLVQSARYYHHPLGEVFDTALPILLRQIEQPKLTPEPLWRVIAADNKAQIPIRAKKQHALWQYFCQHQQASYPELRTLGFNKAQLNALADKQLVESFEPEPEAFQYHPQSIAENDKHQLNSQQALIVSSIEQQAKEFRCHLIEGITGSGKTEVYLQLMEQILKQNQQVLLLVPEIGLTPQTLLRIEQRFNVPIFLHHSGMTDNERLQTWLASYHGTSAIVVGTRSAIFTPMPNLGMIIIDEEHDSSYKQQNGFRYHARDLAILRAKQLNIPIILGSATPSYESFNNAISGKFQHHQLTIRAANAQTANIQLLDLNQQVCEHGIARNLIQAIKQTLERGEQVIIFLNRRGFAPAIICQECKHISQCQRCNSPYTFHKSDQRLVCHHCGSQKRIPKQCPECGSVQLAPLGQGTEQLEHALSELFPDYSAVRIDRDSTSKKGALNKLLQQITNNEHQLLIGTQMIAKGHHFPNVTLVAVLNIDGALFSYDFRATEHLAQLVLQVAGRAGRASKKGHVVIQSQFVDHPLLQDLVNNGYHHLAQQELGLRKQAMLPPFSYQALIRADASNEHWPAQFLRDLAQYDYPCMLAGPIPAPLEKRAGKYRYHLILLASSRNILHQASKQFIAQAEQHPHQHKVRWSIDIDPLDMTW